MTNTIVLQSHTQPLPATWLQSCIDSVKSWAKKNAYAYKFYDDELFNFIDPSLFTKLDAQRVIASDLARLYLLQHYLEQGYHTVIWCDADFLIFSQDNFTLTETEFALGREVWIQQNSDSDKKLICKRKVHNAFLMFRQNNAFLQFYINTALRLLELNTGSMSPQFIGPKLLTALHNIAQFPVNETAGMLSPLVIKDIIHGQGPALDLFLVNSHHPIYAANLCSSLSQQGLVTDDEMIKCINKLLSSVLND